MLYFTAREVWESWYLVDQIAKDKQVTARAAQLAVHHKLHKEPGFKYWSGAKLLARLEGIKDREKYLDELFQLSHMA